ncbi:serine protease [Gammaproteobacteria bacterium]|nr:serine protease [Gammaproteobacteria bacterium]
MFLLIGFISWLPASNTDIFYSNVSGVVFIAGDNGIGSGVIISNDGHILTNWHVIEDNLNLNALTLGEGDYDENLRGLELIKYDSQKDLALLKLKTIPKNVSVIKISKVIQEVGERVHAIGHPRGEMWSYAMGYISAFREGYTWKDSENEQEFSGDVYQMQTPINPGNSGGPLLNEHGNLIGINTFIDTNSQNITFAVTVKEIVSFLAS